MRRILSAAISVAVVASGLVVVAAPAEAANHSKCVTWREHRAITVGKSKASTVKLLDWKGKKVSSKTREYKRCGTGQKVRVTYNKSFSKKSAKVAKVSPKYVAPKPPAKPPVVKPPVKPPVVPPKPPVAQVPGYPDVSIDSVTETSVTLKWTQPVEPHGKITAYKFGWSDRAGNKGTSPEVPTTATSGTYTFKDLKSGVEYKFWGRAKNATGYGEEQWSPWVFTSAGTAGEPPAPITETQELVDDSTCQVLRVTVQNQTRTNTWSWDGTAWVANWGPWTTVSTTERAATSDDCVNVVTTVSSDALLPDLQPKRLDKCGKGDLDATGGTCFKIVNPAPFNSDFPKLEGLKLLKFPVLTMNAGEGPAEVIADRTSDDQTDWRAYQTYYRPNGERQSKVAPGVEFYFAGDGHNHWHFTDFDYYWIESLDGTTLRTAEKHGYCLQDNTSLPGASPEPTYLETTSCGQGLPKALTIIEGLSSGWGDTYPTSLPDQAIDVSGLPDGRYRVGVTVDWLGAVTESSNSNNTTTMEISISGNTVTTYPDTAAGGIA